MGDPELNPPPLPSVPPLPKGMHAEEILSFQENRLVLKTRDHRVLKCLLPPFDHEDAESFRQEFLLLDALDHPCWIRPIRFGALPKAGYWFESELFEAGRLAAFPLRGWWPEVLEIARLALSALDALHHLSVAQCDLKPEQILIRWIRSASRGWTDTETPRGSVADLGTAREGRPPSGPDPEVRLLDLGLAARFGTPLRGRGTPGYMAPEILAGERDWDGRVDLYGFGAVLFELLTGELAFAGNSPREILEAQATGLIQTPRALSDLPPPVRALLLDLLDRDPRRRPHDALEVWQRLREQAPRDHLALAPPRLAAAHTFPFHGREREINRFAGWLAAPSSSQPGDAHVVSGGHRLCLLSGEAGLGHRRLARRLTAVAQTLGWSLAHTPRRSPDGQGAERAFRLERLPLDSIDILCVDEEGGADGRFAEDRSADFRFGDDRASELDADAAACTLVLPLDPLREEELEGMLRGRGLESEILRRTLAANALGSPRLLAAIADAIPKDLDLAARHGGEETLEHALKEGPVPPAWVEWAARVFRSLPPDDAETLLRLSLLAEGSTFGGPDAIGEDTPAINPAINSTIGLKGIDALLRRGLLRPEKGGLVFCSALWARAFAQVGGEQTSAIGHRLLRGSAEGEAISASDAVRLALRLRDWPTLRERLPEALEELAASGRLEDEVLLFRSCLEARPPGPPLLGPSVLGDEGVRRIVSIMWILGLRIALLLPPCLEEEAEDVPESTPVRLLLAMSALARRDLDRGEALLAQDAVHPRDRVVQAQLRFRLIQFRQDYGGAAAELERMRVLVGHDADPLVRLWLRHNEAGLLRHRGKAEDAARLLEEGVPELAALPPLVRASYLQDLSQNAYMRGQTEQVLAYSSEAEAIWRAHGIRSQRQVAVGGLSAAAYLLGNLKQSQVWVEDQLREWARQGRWDTCVSTMINLSLLHLEQGRLGRSLDALREARRFASYTVLAATMDRIAVQTAHVHCRLGRLGEARDGAAHTLGVLSDGVGYLRGLLRTTVAEAALLSHDLETGRQRYREAIEWFADADARDDRVEALVVWGLRESELNETACARERLEEARSCAADASALTLALAALLAGELALRANDGEDAEVAAGAKGTAVAKEGGAASDSGRQLDPARVRDPSDPETAMSLLELAVARLEAQGRWYFAWRARWRLAQAEVGSSAPLAAARNYAAARSILTGLLETLPDGSAREAFLALPAQRAFLAELATG